MMAEYPEAIVAGGLRVGGWCWVLCCVLSFVDIVDLGFFELFRNC